MKTSIKWAIYGVSVGLVAGTCLAYGSSTTQEKTGSTKEVNKMQNYARSGFYDAKSLIGAEIMNDQKQDLGDLKDVVFNPQNRETFVAIGVSHDRCALVPWKALQIRKTAAGKEEITLNSTEQSLESAPSVKGNDWQELNNRSFAQSIYQHYNLQAPASVGGVGHTALGNQSTGSAKSSNSKS